jgi:RimJ/RimL family protein N-acetyltransferase
MSQRDEFKPFYLTCCSEACVDSRFAFRGGKDRIEGDRMALRIRRFEEKDLRSLYELLSDEEVMRYIEPPFTLEKTRGFLKDAGLTADPLIYAVEDENGIFIGYVIYHDYDNESKELGWVLSKRSWRKGFAQVLTEMLVHQARAEGKSAVIECAPEQEATKHIAEKLGFKYAGLIDGCDVYKLDL